MPLRTLRSQLPFRTLDAAMLLPVKLHEALGLNRKSGPITSLHIFDFDGTLVRTPGPVEGKTRYLAGTGSPWKGGWWGRIESLSPPVLDSPCPSSLVIRTVFNEMEDVISRSETAVGVVVTGRITPLRPAVLRILDEICIAAKNDTVPEGKSFLHPDAIFTHPGGRLQTIDFKRLLFRTLLTSEPLKNCEIRDIHIWEDRKHHADIFATELSDELRECCGVRTTVHFVPETMT